MTSFSVLIDTREKDRSIEKELAMFRIPFKKKKLDFGDYSFEWKGKSYEKEIVIERKNSIDEIVGNFTKGRKRFQNEFERSKGAKVYLMIEANVEDIKNRKYRSNLSPIKLMSFLNTWCYKFQLDLNFVKKDDSTRFILKTFKNFLGG